MVYIVKVWATDRKATLFSFWVGRPSFFFCDNDYYIIIASFKPTWSSPPTQEEALSVFSTIALSLQTKKTGNNRSALLVQPWKYVRVSDWGACARFNNKVQYGHWISPLPEINENAIFIGSMEETTGRSLLSQPSGEAPTEKGDGCWGSNK